MVCGCNRKGNPTSDYEYKRDFKVRKKTKFKSFTKMKSELLDDEIRRYINRNNRPVVVFLNKIQKKGIIIIGK